MAATDKISQAFDLVFSEDEARKRRSAIVIFKPAPQRLTTRDPKLRKAGEALKSREAVKDENKKLYESILGGYLQQKAVSTLDRRSPIRHKLAGSGILPIATVEVTFETIKALAKQPNVLAVLPNQNVRLISPIETTENPVSDNELVNHMTWGLQKLGIQEFWEQAGTKGETIKVGVLDTGVFGDHTVLSGKIADFTIIDPAGRRLSLQGNETFDYHRHGTHVCGTIAGGETAEGVAIGVAPESKLAVAQIHFGERSFLSHVIDGIDWAVTMGADVINMSIGLRYYDEQMDQFFKLLVERDIAPVVAIGNDSHGNTSCPGNANHALGVGAVKKSNGHVEVAAFSGGGSLDLPNSVPSRIIKPDVVAPGVDILSCVPSTNERNIDEYRYMDGTSMAAPHVAGIVAILMAACPTKSVAEIFQALRETAEHPAGQARRPDNRWGYGMVRPLDALQSLRQS